MATDSKHHKIARVEATALRVLSSFSWLGVDRQNAASMCLVEVETDTGIKGHGITQHWDSEAVATQVDDGSQTSRARSAAQRTHLARALLDALRRRTGAIRKLGDQRARYSDLGHQGQDPQPADLETPRRRAQQGPGYATIGVPGADIDQLCEAARRLVAMGFKAVETQVGRPGLDHLRGQKPMIEIVRNDARRIKALREALGDEIEIGIDAQCRLDLTHAMELVRLVEPYHVGFFEEPLVAE